MKITHFKFDRLKDLGENFLFFEKYGQTYQCTCGCRGRCIDGYKIEECPSCKTKAIINFNFSKNSACKEVIVKHYVEKLEIYNDEFYINQRSIQFEVNMDISIVNNRPHYSISKNEIVITEDKQWIDLRMYYTLNKKNKRKLQVDYIFKGEKMPFNTSTNTYLYSDSFMDHISKGLRKIKSSNSYSLWDIHNKYKYAPDLTLAGYINIKGKSKELKIMNDLFISEELHSVFDKIIQKVKILSNKNNPLSYDCFSDLLCYGYKNGKDIFNKEFIKFCLDIDEEIALLFENDIKLNTLLKFFYNMGYSPDDANKFMIVALRQHVNLNCINNRDYSDNIEILRNNDIQIEKLPKDIRIFLDKLRLLSSVLNNFKNIDCFLNDYSLIIKSIQYYSGCEKIVKYIKNISDDFFKTLSLIIIDQKREDYIPCEICTINGKQIENIIVLVNTIKDDIDIIEKIYTKDKIYTDKNEIEELLLNIKKKGE